MDKQLSRRDLLSDLPLDIIHTILAFVPIRDAVRTSLLSRQWQYIWASLPHLTFDKKCVNPPIENVVDKRLIHFINQALLLHKGPILKFQLRLSFLAMSRLQLLCIDQWLLFLSMNGVRNLVLEFRDDYPGFKNLSSLYLCKKLTLLKLHFNSFTPPPPSFKGFLFLKSLDIYVFIEDSSTIESIVAHSPLLEELRLSTKNKYPEMTIRAPNLKFFHFAHGFNDSIHLSLCTPLLEELHVRFLTIKCFSFHVSPVLHHLRMIVLFGVPFNRTETTMAVDRLITCSPNLQKLDIVSWPATEDDAPELACASFWDTESVPDFAYDSLKVIVMRFTSCGTNEMKLIKFLLARSPALERMIYEPCSFFSEQRLLSLTAELLSCPRASASAEIVIGNTRMSSNVANGRWY